MKPTLLPLAIAALIPLALVAKTPDTKIVIQSIAAETFPSDAPCYVLYPEGESIEALESSGTRKRLETAFRAMGYTLVGDPNNAAVFLRVNFQQYEPYEVSFDLKSRNKIDYSNAGSTRNYAAMMPGGRYQQLANPTLERDRNNPGAIIGPSGEIIHFSEQEPNAPKIIEGETKQHQVTVYPVTFEVSAWSFSDNEQSNEPQRLWAVLATYNNLNYEDLEPQLLDLCEASERYFGKALKKEKLVRRK